MKVNNLLLKREISFSHTIHSREKQRCSTFITIIFIFVQQTNLKNCQISFKYGRLDKAILVYFHRENQVFLKYEGKRTAIVFNSQ